ncbi:WD40 repeat-like protein, partial [Clavulina sp. PMI_390]
MRFTKPAWVAHQESGDKKRASIFSVNVHPDGSRIATGGLDAKIRIWATLPILRQEYDDAVPGVEGATAPPKKLCTLSMHAGPVLCVRWSHSGKWLASGSDDTIIMVWDLDPTSGGGKVWGSDDVNVEGWKALKRLPGHESDVTDLAFSPEDRYLASVGLDSKVLIWSGANLELLRKLDQHQGFVKGVCWDPVGQYLATQSDDKSVKIWNTTDWSLETTITAPFEKSPGSTFFRRLSWSPDGAHITASNAMNNNGYVFVAAVISRSSWSSNISLVGHENTVEVSAYNPHIFRRDATKPVATQNICSVVALGSDDLSISVWQTKSARPLVVLKDVFDRPIMDLSWSKDGLTLYACSSDGFIGVLDFDTSEMDGIAPLDVQPEYLKLFNFTAPPVVTPYLPSSAPIEQPRHNYAAYNQGPIYHPSRQPSAMPSSNPGQPETVFVNGKKKKRIQPQFVSHLSSGPGGLPTMGGQPPPHSGGPGAGYPPHQNGYQPPPMNQAGPSYDSRGPYPPDRYGPPPGPGGYHQPNGHDGYRQSPLSREAYHDTRMEWEARGPPEGMAFASGRTLGGDRPRERNPVPIREIRTVALPMDIDTRGETSAAGARLRLAIPPVKNVISTKVLDAREGDVFEGKNSDDGSTPPEVSYITTRETQFLDYVSANVIAVAATVSFCAAAMEDSTLNIYSSTGRRIMPSILLDSPCVVLDICRHYAMAITSTGRLYVWNIKSLKAHIPSTIVQPLVAAPTASLLSAVLRPNGAPVLLLSNGSAFSYDADMGVWVKVSEPRWAHGSEAWEGKQRASGSNGVMSSLELSIADMDLRNEPLPVGLRADAPGQVPHWWGEALTLGHLETKIHGARILDSPIEYKTQLLHYTNKLANEGFAAKAEDLLRELAGPLYWKPGREETWTPTVLGMQKRELLKDVIRIFAKSRALEKLGQDWQDTMRKVQAE